MWLLVLRNREHRFVLNDKKKKAGRWTSCFGSLLSAGHVKKKKTNCTIWEAEVEGVRSILKAFSGKFSPSLYRKAGGIELRLFCKALSLPLWHCGESADDGTGSQTAHGGRDPSRKQAGCEQVSSWQGQMGKETSEQSCGERQTLTPLSSWLGWRGSL